MQSTFPGRFVRLADGGWLLQTWGLRREVPVRGLLRLCGDGQILWEAQPTPDLLGVEPASGTILIGDAAGPDPSSVRVMKESSHLVCPSAQLSCGDRGDRCAPPDNSAGAGSVRYAHFVQHGPLRGPRRHPPERYMTWAL